MNVRQTVLILLLGAALTACAVTPPGPSPTPSRPAGPSATATRGGSPLATPTSSELLPIPTATRTPGAPSPAVTFASSLPTPILTPHIITALQTYTPAPTLAPSATPLIAVSTPTRPPGIPTATRPRALPSPVASRPPPATARPTYTRAPTISPILVTAWVSDPNPEPGVDVTVYGRLLVNGQPVAGEGMVARWHMKGRDVDCVGDTWVDGMAYCTKNTYGLPAEYTVIIEVFIKYNQVPYRAATQLTIR